MTAFIIRQAQYLTPCAELLNQNKRGLVGFHDFEKCPDCKRELAHFEAMEAPDEHTQLGPVVGWDNDPEELAERLRKRWPSIPVFRSPAKLTYRR